mmetsp:Transcript_24011/g.36914  ORF Transcript_24011/g.36914 Transcript_24011/m.36914 type:complete len:110 (+) Transcript_24011:3065-3394(+)
MNSSLANSSAKAGGHKQLKQQLFNIKAQCKKAVPDSFVKMNKAIKDREKEIQMMNNSTRRTMTSKRISDNIQKCNRPCLPLQFNDILVSQSASHGNIEFAHKIMANKAN